MITDLTYLTNMSGGNPGIVKEMIGIFIEQVQEYVVEMQQYLKDKDYQALGRLSHKAKSSVAIMGMNELAADLKTLELLSKESVDIDKYPELVDRFVVQCQLAMVELKEKASELI